ncbi:hypothetical protein Q8A67_005254 [Cirrhinus molitorella]|uniref:Ig-like domain-containing protein n=1 Tax=Cirrhinus molitorella TaxID=172907 RepID=A0AA88QBZ7_9TELE|nr:hypothetical protein Q8A67_005254 [Cirrhinus molitorella]
MCSSDSNPPALNFSWFRVDESSSVGSGQSFSTLLSGHFYCEAHNQHGSQRSDAVTVTEHHRSSWHVVFGVIVECGVSLILVTIIIIIIMFMMREQKGVKTEDLTMKQNDLYSGVSQRVSVHDEPVSEADTVNDALYSSVKPSRSRGKTPESRDTEEIQYATVQYHRKKETNRPEDNEYQSKQRIVKTEDLTIPQNDLYSDVSQRVSVHDEPPSEADKVNDTPYASVHVSRFRGKTLESSDTEEIQYATVQYQQKKETNRPEDIECQYEDIRVHQPDAAVRQSNVHIVEDVSVIYSSVK